MELSVGAVYLLAICLTNLILVNSFTKAIHPKKSQVNPKKIFAYQNGGPLTTQTRPFK